MLKVHQEVVVELDEEVALLERRQRDSLLELHRELMPQLALVEAPELGEDLGELGLLARLPVEEGVNLSGAAHRSRLEPARFPYPLDLVRGDDTGADGRPDRRAPLDVNTRPDRESPVRLVSLTRRRRCVAKKRRPSPDLLFISRPGLNGSRWCGLTIRQVRKREGGDALFVGGKRDDGRRRARGARREAEMEMRRKAPRELDGTDLRAKRRKTFDAQDGGGDDGDGATGGEADESLERYEYAAPDAIVRGLGCVGFVVTCSFQREKSATRRRPRCSGPRLPTTKGLRLNPVKMPGRGFVLIRMSERPNPDASDARGRDDQHPGDPNDDDDGTRAIVAAEAVGVVTRTVADVKAGRCPAPRFVEKITPVTATCALDRAAIDAGAVAALAASGFDAKGCDVSFAVSYHNRFKTQGGSEGGQGGGWRRRAAAPAAERHGRREVIEAVAGGVRAALTAAGATGVNVDPRDPDVVAFAEVISVLATDNGQAG